MPETPGDTLFTAVVETLEPGYQSDPVTLHKVRQLADLENLKAAHEADIAERGVIEQVVQAHQTFHRPNASVGQVLRIVGEQRRILAALPLRDQAAEDNEPSTYELLQRLRTEGGDGV